eukprot:c5211_g1_i1.p1 GENE.c5211_g1_i1~~c5211_g1_i1.p1  ORF type:complete len:741 (+),score=221.74 c5211_g1_i1:107-2329(+)
MSQPLIALEDGLATLRTKGTERYQRIAANDFIESFTPAEFMELNTVVYQMCTQASPYVFTPQLYEEYNKSVERYVKDIVVNRLTGKRDEFLLQTLVKEHDNFKVYIRMMKNVFQYLNRFYVQRNALSTLEDVGTIKFDEGVFCQSIGEEIRNATLQMILKDREGEKVDRQLIRSVTTIYVDLGHEDTANEKYNVAFEDYFLVETKNYYSAKSVLWLQESLPEYLVKVESVLEREQKFAQECLPGSSLSKLERHLDVELLINHQKTLLERENGGFSTLLADVRTSDLKRMYKLFSRVPKGLEPLAEQFCSFVTKKGKELVEIFEPEQVSQPEAIVEFVNKLIKMHDSYNSLLVDCFSNSGLFNKAMKEAFESFINSEMGPTGSKIMCAELLSSYCDTLLKSTGEKMSDDNLEKALEDIVKLFNYLSDKDLFSEFYRKQLARRLLQKRSSSDDAEYHMLEMLKIQCGAQYTSKLEGMVRDLTISKEQQQNFKDYLSNTKLDVDFEVQVLTTGYWPSYPALELNLPANLTNCLEVFKKFYEVNTKHRRLHWLHSMGQVILGTHFSKPSELVVSTPQACILILFNNTEKFTFDEIRSRLNLSQDEAIRQLLTLSAGKFRLLKKEPASKTISSSDTFSVNESFTSDKKRVKVPTISLKEISKEDKETTGQAVAEDRKHAIEAAIVRIMKARKQLDFQKLVLETSQQLIRLFKPDVKLIKTRMEDLIAREYLERDPNNPKIIRYLA